jgi:hypothetical protein
MLSQNEPAGNAEIQYTESLSRRGFLLKSGATLALLAMMDSDPTPEK